MRKLLILTVFLSLILASCGTFEVSVEQIPTATSGAGQFFATPTFVPTTLAILATATASVTPATPTRIQFAAGATQSVTDGLLEPGQTSMWVLKASKGQILIASADSPAQDVTLSIRGADGSVLLPGKAAGSASFTGVLPATQDYYFQLTAGAQSETFILNVVVVARVQFDPGGIKTVLKGTTVNGYPVTYAAYAQKGQKMDVILDAPGDTAGLTIWGFNDGEPYARAQNAVRDFSLVLPSTQDYIVQVVPHAGQVINYTVTIQIK